MSSDDTVRVLLIDDDQSALFLTQAILEQIPGASFIVDWVSSAEEGRVAIARQAHDVYLVDYLLGESSGIELVRAARAARNRAPMILLTGKGRYEVDVEAMEAGVSDYLEKDGVTPDALERSIRYARARHRAEAALRDSEERHRSMFDHLPIGLFRTTKDGALLDANPALVQILGHPDREALESGYAQNFFVGAAKRQAFAEQLESGVVRGFESSLQRPDGTTVHIRCSARAHRALDGRMVYLEGAIEDVSEERHAQDLHGRAARFSWVFEESGLGILLLDLAGRVTAANPAFLRSFDYTTAEIVGRSLTEIADEGDRDALTSELGRVASGAVEVSEAQRRLAAVDGEILWARTRTGLVRSADGRPDHVIVLFEDVAET